MFHGRLLPFIGQLLLKMLPQHQFFRPIMFPIYLLSLVLIVGQLGFLQWDLPIHFMHAVTGLIVATVILAIVSETIALQRGQDQAESLKKTRENLQAKRLKSAGSDTEYDAISANDLALGDLVLLQAGDLIPCDGEVIKGVASVNESALTGESAPVIRESGGDRSAVLAGTKIISDWLIVRVSQVPGHGFVDQMIAMVEGAKRQKMPSELMLTSFLAALTALLIWVCVSIFPLLSPIKLTHQDLNLVTIIALFVCLAPTTIGGLLPAISIAGMVRMFKLNVLAMNGTAVEAAGNISILILDKTGTITLGNRQATELRPAKAVLLSRLLEVAYLTSFFDETAEGRSIILLCQSLGFQAGKNNPDIHYIPFTAETRMSGAVLPGRQLRKGSAQAIQDYLDAYAVQLPEEVQKDIEEVSRQGGTPLVVIENTHVLGIIVLKDIIKPGLKERFAEFRRFGVKTMMVTGDNPLTAAAIAAEAGVDDFMANAKPQHKLELIEHYQAQGLLVAMTGDGTNDAPALAQADVGLAMNNGTQAAKEAGNLLDLDSDPGKLIEIILVGKSLIMTRGALTTFSICNDIAKFFALLPVLIAACYPQLAYLNIMHLSNPLRAVIASLLVNFLLMLMVVPLALKGIQYGQQTPKQMLKKNLLIYGLGGTILPFLLIKLFDMIFALIGYLA
ncbi:MAG: K(+)-transporting ATPase subunit B [Gammaproteobacteria bacterium]|nr:K(+)-transporting ATPase subunit B [Gammaproteobacteria bacterium]